MFVVLLKFAGNKAQAGQYMQGHKDWIVRGYEDGVFLLTGSLKPPQDKERGGGGIVAHNTSFEALQTRVGEDPFVAENVVSAEIIEIAPSQADEKLAFLLT